MKSVVSYPDRGPDGKSSYRGNCSGKIIEDCIKQYGVKDICDYMAGSYTTQDVAKRLGVPSHCYDLNHGFDVMTMDLPERSQFTFWHPPYHDMIVYSGEQYDDRKVIEQYGFDPKKNDLSRCASWEEFVGKMNECCMKMYNALDRGGRLAVLMGDMKRKGVLYSMLADIVKPGTLEQIIIKMQHNCVSDRNTYSNQNFVPIVHEYLMVLRKDNLLYWNISLPTFHKVDMRDMDKTATWRDAVCGVIRSRTGNWSLADLYAAFDGHKKTKTNPHWQEKIRQTLQSFPNLFRQVERGVWCAA